MLGFVLFLAGFGVGGGDQAGGDRDHAEADDQDQEGEEAAARGDGVDVAVADRGERGDGPPGLSNIDWKTSGWASCSHW